MITYMNNGNQCNAYKERARDGGRKWQGTK